MAYPLSATGCCRGRILIHCQGPKLTSTRYQIWALPKLAIVFATSIIKDIPPVLSDSFNLAALSLPEDPPRKLSELDIDLLQVAQIGAASPQPHLVVSAC